MQSLHQASEIPQHAGFWDFSSFQMQDGSLWGLPEYTSGLAATYPFGDFGNDSAANIFAQTSGIQSGLPAWAGIRTDPEAEGDSASVHHKMPSGVASAASRYGEALPSEMRYVSRGARKCAGYSDSRFHKDCKEFIRGKRERCPNCQRNQRQNLRNRLVRVAQENTISQSSTVESRVPIVARASLSSIRGMVAAGISAESFKTFKTRDEELDVQCPGYSLHPDTTPLACSARWSSQRSPQKRRCKQCSNTHRLDLQQRRRKEEALKQAMTDRAANITDSEADQRDEKVRRCIGFVTKEGKKVCCALSKSWSIKQHPLLLRCPTCLRLQDNTRSAEYRAKKKRQFRGNSKAVKQTEAGLKDIDRGTVPASHLTHGLRAPPDDIELASAIPGSHAQSRHLPTWESSRDALGGRHEIQESQFEMSTGAEGFLQPLPVFGASYYRGGPLTSYHEADQVSATFHPERNTLQELYPNGMILAMERFGDNKEYGPSFSVSALETPGLWFANLGQPNLGLTVPSASYDHLQMNGDDSGVYLPNTDFDGFGLSFGLAHGN